MMRAKMLVTGVSTPYAGCERIKFMPVCGNKPFGQNGEHEDNTYSKWTPTGELSLDIQNPGLLGKFTSGQKFYLDFTEAKE